ncbi:MAG TPA: MarR family transcriptional regulator [Nonomuraea sp.]|nr:MarR family transcriptional regulator [Nonomuraea sp.]
MIDTGEEEDKVDSTTPGPQLEHHQLLEALRSHAMAFNELGRKLGAQAGLHVTDANALVEILGAQDSGQPLTQTQLSQRIGLSTAATSSLLNRLENAGHVRRARDSADRRLVTLHSTDSAEALVDRFFDPLVERMSALADTYPPQTLAAFTRFLEEICATMTAYAGEVAQREPRT